MKPVLKKLPFLVLGIAIGYSYMHFAQMRMKPIHSGNYETLTKEIYTYIKQNDELPVSSELTLSSQQIIKASNGISYSKANGSSFTYDKSYPVNTPILGSLTFGLYLGDSPIATGSSMPPKDLFHNAKLKVRPKN